MGKKKKFIDKKKSATFQLLARDSSHPNFDHTPGADRVFVRVDNNPVPAATFDAADDPYGVSGACYGGDDDGDDPNSIFDDAPEDDDEDGNDDRVLGKSMVRRSGEDLGVVGTQGALPEDVREILELGLPDDGYNYLIHMREIKNAGGGSAFYHNPKFRVEHVPRDVKAYDASRLQISQVNGEAEERSLYSVASKTTSVRVQKGVDPEVAALLDDSDLSQFGSDVEDLEEDFVVQANHPEDPEEEMAHMCNSTNLAEESAINRNNAQVLQVSAHSKVADDLRSLDGATNGIRGVDCDDEKPRVHRLLDEQFDLLQCQEYGPDDDDDDGDYYENYQAEDEFLAEKLKLALKDHVMDGLQPDDDHYKVPAELLKDKEATKSEEQEDSVAAADVIRRCKEYAEGYEVEDEDKDVVLVEESSDESEVWDCETIVSTYSNLDNHPGKIEAPEVTRKKKLAETMSAVFSSSNQIISLRGKEKLPVDFLLGSSKPASEKVKGASPMGTEQFKRKHGLESKEEKKERKAAVKEERREARRVKKEMKGLYRCEGHRAQRAAAVSGPSSIHLV